jgi:serine/threonine protein kinase
MNSATAGERYSLRKFLGRGTWGDVYLAQRRSDSALFALKIIRRPEDLASIESTLLSTISHPFIVSCVDSFVAKQKLHICLEYVAGGDLAFHIASRGPFRLDEAKLIVAQIALALRALHRRGIVYRDLKPENVVLGCDGYIKLTDFGLSAEVSACTRVCGTYEYLAPEVLAGRQYGPAVDWWALGILFFELLFGRTPFYAMDRDRMREKILNRAVIVPDHSGSGDVASLMYGLLEKDPDARFGFDEVAGHALFEDVDFDQLLEKKVVPKFKPGVFDPKSSVAKSLAEMRGWRGSYDVGDSTVENVWKSVSKPVENSWKRSQTSPLKMRAL